MIATKQLCTFKLGGHLFGVDAQSVQEVIRYQEMTKVPMAPPAISGLINLRGQIVTAVDLRLRLGLGKLEGNRKPMNVVVRSDDGAVSLLVDQIGDVIEVDDRNFEEPPDTLSGTARDLILGAYKLEGQLLLLLDCDEAVQVASDKKE
jgi:purine-binding chemotaxis protein CheW